MFKNQQKKITTSIFLIIYLVLSGCGGSSPVDVNSSDLNFVSVPDCNPGSGKLSGCWVSEQCATTDSYDMRYLGWFDELLTNPIRGEFHSYALVYEKNTACNGVYQGAIKLDLIDADNFINVDYEEGMDLFCTETSGSVSDVSCTTLDLTTNSTINSVILPEYLGYTTFAFTNEGERLCFPSDDYNFDTSGSGSIQAQSDTFYDDEINLLNCLTSY